MTTPAAETISRTGRIEFLEAVRGIAALVVVLYHAAALASPAFEQFSRNVIDFGRVGVVAFFLVSGYIIPLSIRGRGVRSFAVRRFFRLYPLYWLVLAIALIVFAARWGTPPFDLIGIVSNAAMLQSYVGAESIISVAWTLCIELLFYVQIAVFALLKRLDVSYRMGWFWLAVFLATGVVQRLGAELPTFTIFLVLAGMGQAFFLLDDPRRRAEARALIVAGIVLVPVGVLIGVDDSGLWPPATAIASYLGGVLVFVAAYALRGRVVPAALLWLGTISYALYLVHPLLLDAAAALAAPWAWVAAVLASILLAPLAHRFVERPAIALGRRLTPR
ncbi:acyltransferase [Microbacteriaceae bacterium VKM Ac-2854]|nr:acyltransferase [Microbacteriaceae bacterium VKM Ac-2854]